VVPRSSIPRLGRAHPDLPSLTKSAAWQREATVSRSAGCFLSLRQLEPLLVSSSSVSPSKDPRRDPITG
jgi:hypothetical protein